jgi:hypothetical protein
MDNMAYAVLDNGFQFKKQTEGSKQISVSYHSI